MFALATVSPIVLPDVSGLIVAGVVLAIVALGVFLVLLGRADSVR